MLTMYSVLDVAGLSLARRHEITGSRPILSSSSAAAVEPCMYRDHLHRRLTISSTVSMAR